MKNKAVLFSLGILLICCGTKITHTSNSLTEYKNFIATLDSFDITTSVSASKKYVELFKNEVDTSKRDSGFAIFDEYFAKINSCLNDTTNKNLSDSLIYADSLGNPLPVSKKLKEYKTLIENNGFVIASSEGTAYIKQNRDLIANYFYDYVSTPMKEYLIQRNKENKEGFSEDAGLVIEPKTFVDRLVFWEKFLSKNPNFVHQKLIQEEQKEFLTCFFIGIPNTPVLWNNVEGGDSLNDYYKTAYSYLESNFPQSEINKLVNPYFKFLFQKKNKQADSLLKDYENKNIISNYSN